MPSRTPKSRTDPEASAPPAPSSAPLSQLVPPHQLLAAEVDLFLRIFEGDDSGDASALLQVHGGGENRLHRLSRAFDLSEFEGAVVGLCVACELFPLRFRRVAAAALGFGDELSMGTLTPHLALLWLGGLEGASPQAFLPGGPLLRWGLLDTRAGLTFDQSLRGLSIPAGVLAFLQGHDAPDPALDGVAQLIPASLVGQVALSDSQEGLVGQLQGFLDGDPAGRAGLLYGADASARQEVARRALGGLKAGVLVVNLAGLNSSGPGSSGLAQPAKEGQPDERAARLRALARDSRLKGMAVLLDATGDTEEGAMGNLVAAAMDAAAGPVVVVCEDALPLQVARAVLPLEVHKPSVQEQRALWAAALGLPDPQLAALQRLTDQFHLDAARIGSLAREVRADLPGNAGYAARLDRAWTACRVAGRRRIGGLAQRVSTGATWDDVILADSDLSVLRQIVAHVQHRAAVNDLLGAPTGGRGRAVAALFSGPSGTGKTLSAEVVANALNLDLYRIDLSGMVSKYIGETEKNLKLVFDAADDGGAVLLFDEADALFGKRSEVKDAHDRYANIQVNYLLQRLEAFSGVAILTTNLESSMDIAFMRRLQFVLPFRAPQARERERLWRQVFPAGVDVEGLDFGELAQVTLAGGSIRNVAVNALYLAVSRGEALGMNLMREALQLEFRKTGRLNLGSGSSSGTQSGASELGVRGQA
ncbi:ATP-binding protein [Deinococcus aquatilis]|uniref:ATP-binding protein n=1 Tax=Deinococcus aquatilis TaxID=519440 RepID=UPI00039F5050|nr:ATP-binding protein [Deinococcus aquatilis]